MAPLMLMLRVLLILGRWLTRSPTGRPGARARSRQFHPGDVVRVGVDTRRWRITNVYAPNGLGLQALDDDRFIVLNHAQITSVTWA